MKIKTRADRLEPGCIFLWNIGGRWRWLWLNEVDCFTHTVTLVAQDEDRYEYVVTISSSNFLTVWNRDAA